MREFSIRINGLPENGTVYRRRAARGIVRRGDRLLMIHCAKKGDYKFPGGGVKPDETLESALCREMLEEAGRTLIGTPEPWAVVHERRKGSTADILEMDSHYFFCDVEEEEAPLQLEGYEAEEGMHPVWITPEEALRVNRTLTAEEANPWVQREILVLEALCQEFGSGNRGMNLREFFQKYLPKGTKAALGFSGGVDSAYLLWEAVRCGASVRPYFVKSAFQPEFELRDAQRLCKELGVELTVLPLDVLSCEKVRENPPDRCYHCKRAIFAALRDRAIADGCALLLDGTNASDDAGDRPGMRALRELSVRSPLRECGLSKREIRELSRKAGLFTWDKPAYACLATRIPSGTKITAETLSRVERAEDRLFALGFSDFRVRVYHGAARIQLPENQMPLALERREEILRDLSPLFPAVMLDLVSRE